MSSKNGPDDLFGKLSDSDSSDNEMDLENDKDAVRVLQDLEMSCSSEDDESDQENSQQMELSPSQSMESVSQEDYRDITVVSYHSENGYSSSVPTVSTSSSRSSDDIGPSASNEMILKRPESSSPNYEALDVSDPFLDETLQMEQEPDNTITLPAENDQALIVPKRASTQSSSGSHKQHARFDRKVSTKRSGSSFTDKNPDQEMLDTGVKEEVLLARELLLANFSKEQMDRYEAFRKSKFKRSVIRNLVTEATGSTPTDSVSLAICVLTKMFVGEIVEEAVELRDASISEKGPLQPKHINNAFKKLYQEGKLWPPYGLKY